MQKLFIIRETDSLSDIHEFIGKNGTVISVTANFVSTSSSARSASRWLVVADDGKGNLKIS